MSKIVIVFHSGYGHTAKIAQAVAEGSGGALLAIDAEGNLPDGGWEQLAAADTIVMGSPTYMGGPSWQFKKVADASSKVWFKMGWKDKLAAGFTNSGTLNGDKFSTLQYMFTLSQQHGMLWTGMGLQAPNAKKNTRDDVNHLGGYAASSRPRRPMPRPTRWCPATSPPPRPSASAWPRSPRDLQSKRHQ